jgi:DNA-binding beta-propeller fold protein YncE
MVFDSSGNLYVANDNSNTIIKITPGGTQSLFATVGTGGNLGQIVTDSAGNFYTVNFGDSLYKITPSGTVTTFASGGALTSAIGLAIDPAGNFYVSNFNEHTIAKVTSGGVVSLYANDVALNQPASLVFVPEPAEWGLMLGAVSLAGVIWHRRRSRPGAASAT